MLPNVARSSAFDSRGGPHDADARWNRRARSSLLAATATRYEHNLVGGPGAGRDTVRRSHGGVGASRRSPPGAPVRIVGPLDVVEPRTKGPGWRCLPRLVDPGPAHPASCRPAGTASQADAPGVVRGGELSHELDLDFGHVSQSTSVYNISGWR